MVNYLKTKYIRIMILLLILVGVFIMFFSCCNTLAPDENLTLQRTDYIGNELRIDGYYVHYFAKGKTDADFFFENGTVFRVRGRRIDGISDYSEKRFLDANFIRLNRDTKTNWSVFEINGDDIVIQGWTHSSGGGIPIATRRGKILNDTTFVITSIHIHRQTREINEVYHFRKFSPKPDSTNSFIK